MRFLSLGWIRRNKDGRNAIGSEADRLVHQFGVNAYEEARRRRRESDHVSSARYWSAVKSEIGRNILNHCDEADFLDRLEVSLFASDLSWRADSGQAAESRMAPAGASPGRRQTRLEASNDNRTLQKFAVRKAW